MSKSPSFKKTLIKNAVIFNPVLVQLVGLCPVIAASSSLKNAVVLSLVASVELAVVCVVASAVFRKLPAWVRVPLYFVTGLALIFPALWYVETQTLAVLSLGMKIFIPLVAINSVVAVRCEQFAVKNSVKSAFLDSVTTAIGASAVFIVAGALREIMSNGTIGGINLNLSIQLKGMMLPFGCLVILGFMAAALKTFVAKKYPDYSDEPESAEEKAVEPEREEPQVIQEISEAVSEAEEIVPSEESIKIRTEEEIEEFFRSLGIDLDKKEGAE